MKLSEQGFPYCPVCKGVLYWESDFTKEELCFVPAYSQEANDVVHCLHCAGCNRDFYYMPDNSEEQAFIDVSRY